MHAGGCRTGARLDTRRHTVRARHQLLALAGGQRVPRRRHCRRPARHRPAARRGGSLRPRRPAARHAGDCVRPRVAHQGDRPHDRVHDARRRGEARSRRAGAALRTGVQGSEQGTRDDPPSPNTLVRHAGLATAVHRSDDTRRGTRDGGYDSPAQAAGRHIRVLGLGGHGAHAGRRGAHRTAARRLPRRARVQAARDDEHALPATVRMARPNCAHRTQPGWDDHPGHGAR